LLGQIESRSMHDIHAGKGTQIDELPCRPGSNERGHGAELKIGCFETRQTLLVGSL